MHVSIHHRTLLGRVIAAAVMLAGTSACSHKDRSYTGRDATQGSNTGAVAPADTQSVAGQPSPATSPVSTDTAAKKTSTTATRSDEPKVSGYRSMSQDTATTADTGSPEMSGAAAAAPAPADTAQNRNDKVAAGDSANIGRSGERIEPTVSSQQANADTLANQPESDRVRPPEDSSEAIGAVSSDSAVAGSSEMARDTSTALAQGDTVSEATMDTAVQVSADTGVAQAKADSAVEPPTEMAQQAPADSGVVQAQVDTAAAEPTEMAQQAPVDSTAAQPQVDRDSTEVLSNETEQRAAVTADQADVSADTAAVAAAGVEPTGNLATGAEAVALMTREGRRCTVVDADESRDARWDLASSPATLNPCGTGTMTLPRVQAGEK